MIFRIPPFLLVGFALALLLLTGCERILLESRQEYWINPDGSGKARIEATWSTCIPVRGKPGGESKPRCQITPPKLLALLRDESQGVEAWSNLRLEKQPGLGKDKNSRQRTTIRGTVYFNDIRQLWLSDLSSLELELTGTGETRTFQVEYPPPKSEKSEKGAFFFNLNFVAEAIAEDLLEEKGDARAKEIFKQEAGVRKELKKSPQDVREYRYELLVHLPGKPSAPQEKSGKVLAQWRLLIDGGTIRSAMEGILEERIYHKIAEAGTSAPARAFLRRKVLGKESPISVELTGPFQPLFNFRVELALAQAGEAAMFKKLGVPEPPLPSQKSQERRSREGTGGVDKNSPTQP